MEILGFVFILLLYFLLYFIASVVIVSLCVLFIQKWLSKRLLSIIVPIAVLVIAILIPNLLHRFVWCEKGMFSSPDGSRTVTIETWPDPFSSIIQEKNIELKLVDTATSQILAKKNFTTQEMFVTGQSSFEVDWRKNGAATVTLVETGQKYVIPN